MKLLHHHLNKENYMIQIMKISAKKNMMMPSRNYKVASGYGKVMFNIYFISSGIQGKEKQGKPTCYCEEFDGKN